jgi:hypothetical protein
MAAKKTTAVTRQSIDLDALEQIDRAERDADGALVGPELKFKGETFVLVDEIPLDVVVALGEIDETDKPGMAKIMVRTIRILFADGDWERFLALKPTMNNLMQMYGQVFAAYAGLTPGESAASAKSSRGTGTRPRQRSSATTAST